MNSSDPRWVGCFCEVWPGVIYSPTGPLLPAALVQRLLLQFRSPLRVSQETEMPPNLLRLQSMEAYRVRELTEDETTDLTAFYNSNPVCSVKGGRRPRGVAPIQVCLHILQSVARKHLIELLLEPVDPAMLPPQIPPELLGTREWLRLRTRVDFSARPGLDVWLHSCHGSEMLIR